MRDKFDEIAERLALDLSDGSGFGVDGDRYLGRSALLKHGGQWVSLHEPEGVTALADRLRREMEDDY